MKIGKLLLSGILLSFVTPGLLFICEDEAYTECVGDCISNNDGTQTKYSTNPNCMCNERGTLTPCTNETDQPCSTICGCGLLPCNPGECDQHSIFKDYTCICPIGLTGNQSQDCNTELGTSDGSALIVGSADITSPFYPSAYPTLIVSTWLVAANASDQTIELLFTDFNLAPSDVPDAAECLTLYEVMRSDNIAGRIQDLTDTEVNATCPCIYDMLMVYEGNSTDIVNIKATYCANNPPPSSLESTTDMLTLVFRTDFNNTAGSGFFITANAVINECLSSPCQNGGTCYDLDNAYNCTCTPEYSGTNCEIQDYCYIDNCHNGATCHSGDTEYTCTCPSGYTDSNCQTQLYCETDVTAVCNNGGTCQEDNPGWSCACAPAYNGTNCDTFDNCFTDHCLNGATCESLPTGYACTCPDGYTGENCETELRCVTESVVCNNGGTCQELSAAWECNCTQAYSGTTCDTFDYCFTDNCVNAGTCESYTTDYNCTCPPGYVGQNCQIEERCVTQAVVCENGGTCAEVDTGDRWRCNCTEAYTGDTCTIYDFCYNHSNCEHNSTCVSQLTDYNCSCLEGYSGKNCQTEQYCITQTDAVCENGGTCVEENPGWSCYCTAPYIGDTCTIYDFCYNHSNCEHGSTCVSQLTDYNCTCLEGYIGKNCQTEEHCITQSDAVCENGGTCVEGNPGWSCNCSVPYSGDTCTIYDYCYNHSNCEHNSTCVSQLSDYNCTCLDGFTGKNCQTELLCTTQAIVCANGGTCMDTPASYTCVCPRSFYGDNCTLSCGGTVDLWTDTSTQYNLISPGYPSNYPHFLHCDWNIVTLPGRTIQLVFSTFDVDSADNTACAQDYEEHVYQVMTLYDLNLYNQSQIQDNAVRLCPCLYDMLFVYDGNLTTQLDEIGVYCNGRPPDRTVTSTLHSVTATFHTNSDISTQGFQITASVGGDDCDPPPCENGGTCQDLADGEFSCTCADSFTGSTCATDVNECAVIEAPCNNDSLAVCANTHGSYVCECQDSDKGVTWNGTACTTGEVIDNICSVQNGQCQHECEPFSRTDSLSDVINYQCTCNQGYQLSNDQRTCNDIDECSTNCTSSTDPSPSCLNLPGSFMCSCPQGYLWDLITGECENINECENSDPPVCDFNCTDTRGSYNCSCLTGYGLLESGRCWDVDECENNNGNCQQLCSNEIGSYSCSCEPGYSLSDDSTSCDDDNECLLNNGGCSQNCSNVNGSYSCLCRAGYTLGIDGETCSLSDQACDTVVCAQGCVNVDGTPTCLCANGYTVNGTACEDIDECSVNNGGCSSNCTNTVGSFQCSCSPGYGLLPDERNCQDVNECDAEECSYSCVNSPGSYSCLCPDGFTYNSSTSLCDDVNECVTDNAHCQQTCVNSNGSYSCQCHSGYSLWQDGRTCGDIDECIQSTLPLCDQTCVNDQASYHCTCLSNYELTDNGVTCNGPYSVTIQITLSLNYTANMSDPNSPEYWQLVVPLKTWLKSLGQEISVSVSVQSPTQVTVVSLSRGSVVAVLALNYPSPVGYLEQSLITYYLSQRIQQAGTITLGADTVPVIGPVIMVHQNTTGASMTWNIDDLCHVYNNLNLCQNATCQQSNNIPSCICSPSYGGVYCESKVAELPPTSIIVISVLLPLGLLLAFTAAWIVYFKRTRWKPRSPPPYDQVVLSNVRTDVEYNVRIQRSDLRQARRMVKGDTKHYNTHTYGSPYRL